MVIVHAGSRRSSRSAYHLSQYRKPNSVFLIVLACLAILPFTTLGGGVGVTNPGATTWTVQSLNNGASYQAFLSGTSGAVFTETNFTRIMYNDIEHSAICTFGCSIALDPGSYNQTQRLVIDIASITITGVSASVIYPSNVVYSSAFRPVFDIFASGFTAIGFKIDDYKRANQTSTGLGFFMEAGTSNAFFNQLTIYNASDTGINIQGSNTIVSFSTIISTLCKVASRGNSCNTDYGILMGATASSIRIDFNTISMFNFTDTSGVQMASQASNIEVGSNEIFANSFGVSSTWGVSVDIHDNKIHDNYGAGILLTTPPVGSFKAGPVVISANIIVNNGKEPGNDVVCNNGHCPGIMMRGTKTGFDGVSIVNNAIRDNQATPTQQYAIYIISTQYTNLTITGNSVGVSRSGQTIVLTVNPLKTWTIADNPGFNPQPVRGPLTAGATPFTYTNNDGYLEQIELITIGDMTAFTCRGIANIIQVDAISPILNTLDTCVFTYIVNAPTYDVLPT